MNRSEFLNRLREALENDLGGSAVQEHILYYDEYIRNEIRNGKTEREVLDMLGDPWIIAKTIIAAGGNAATQENSSWSYDTGDEEKRNNKSRGDMIAHILGIDTWWKKILFFLGVILVILVIFEKNSFLSRSYPCNPCYFCGHHGNCAAAFADCHPAAFYPAFYPDFRKT